MVKNDKISVDIEGESYCGKKRSELKIGFESNDMRPRAGRTSNKSPGNIISQNFRSNSWKQNEKKTNLGAKVGSGAIAQERTASSSCPSAFPSNETTNRSPVESHCKSRIFPQTLNSRLTCVSVHLLTKVTHVKKNRSG